MSETTCSPTAEHVACTKDQYHHVLKSDAYPYYESIDHGVLLGLLKHYVLRQVIRLTHKV